MGEEDNGNKIEWERKRMEIKENEDKRERE